MQLTDEQRRQIDFALEMLLCAMRAANWEGDAAYSAGEKARKLLAAHSAVAQGANVHTCALCGSTGDCKAKDPRLLNDCQGAWYRPAAQPMPQTDSAGAPGEPYGWIGYDNDSGLNAAFSLGPAKPESWTYYFPLYAHPQPMPQTDAARDVLAERQRQISEEGAKPEEDDAYKDHELARAAIAYARSGIGLVSDGNVPTQWPWMTHWWKPSTPRRDLVKAAALILAEIERLDRAKGE